MIIGVPKEIKNNENRVALTPAGAKELIKEAIRSMYNRLQVLEVVFLTKTTRLRVRAYCQASKPPTKLLK